MLSMGLSRFLGVGLRRLESPMIASTFLYLSLTGFWRQQPEWSFIHKKAAPDSLRRRFVEAIA
jgi:hypothetical protein